LVSDALAAILILEPVAKLLPSAGLVIETTGCDGAVTVIVTELDVVGTPLASVAYEVSVVNKVDPL
jgi:hypothetical protein